MALLSRLDTLIDGAGVRVVRSFLGLAMAWEAMRFLLNDWIDGFFQPGSFHFLYFGFEWVRPWPGYGMHIQMALLCGLALVMALGWKARACSALLALGWAHVFLIDQANYLNHLYLVVLLLILFAWIPLQAGRVPLWGLWLLRFQVGLVYVLGGVAKISDDWLAGEPMTQWMADRAGMPVIGEWLASAGAGITLSWAGLIFDLVVVPMLLWRRTRALAFALTVVFHGFNAVLFNIGIFPWLMLAATTVFFVPSWPRVLLRQDAVSPTGGRYLGRVGVAMLVLWAGVQVVVPLRHWAYPGDVAWTEEGHRFSWRMKLRSKKGRVFFHVLDRRTGEQEKLDPCQDISLHLCRKMSTRPDMILQYAHHIRDARVAAGQDLVAVHADAIGRLNQREPQRLVNPRVDLARVQRNLSPAPWIVPLLEREE